MRFQFQHGFYYAYLLMTIIYIWMLKFVPVDYLDSVTVVVVFSDPSFLGAFFIGGIVLLEKSQGVYDAFFVTPLRVGEFLLSKILSLSIISLLSSVAIVLMVHSNFDVIPFLVGILLSSVVFTLIGLLLAVRVNTVNQFLLTSPLVLMVFFVPVFGLFEWWDSILFKWLPSYAGLLLIEGTFHDLNIGELFLAISILMLWAVGLYLWAKHDFHKYILAKAGDEK
ncbi:ABC transporter permease [Bacillus tianshenii]|uniref:fluoroquinolone export ABC transporter permease subunit n=1 Tax=Sutcliffiella tianshenii TaxID=1463404 RepID=UPI001CD63F26|nr:ABC transporter permease [Bacillus tianshenii]MCA1320648.1 ABC transporter permease [Bacillus tianshenii]